MALNIFKVILLPKIMGNAMKKWFLGLCLIWSFSVNAQMPYIEEAKALGMIAGQGLACEASKYQTFELLARAIILTKSPSAAQQSEGLKAYLEEKADVFVSKQLDNFADCRNIARRFDEQDIFKTTLYADGTIKMPDGQIFTPREPYDATGIYDTNSHDLQKANAIYNRDLSNVKKVEFTDKTVTTGNQFNAYRNRKTKQKVIASPKLISR